MTARSAREPTPLNPFEKIEIKITFDPATSLVNVEGPGLLQARTMYDFIFAEIHRMTLLQFVEKAQGSRIAVVAGSGLPHASD